MGVHNQSPHSDHPNIGIGNDVPKVNSPDVESRNREAFMMNADGKLHLGFDSKGEADPFSAYGETHGHERGWGLQHQLNPCSWSWKIE
ncbi:hypothetical protein V6N13_004642 [Hibiscus sabdariffa]|uniref:Uncharacterized protein n=1 Tax=Hibiscus sabdariffa TaxID=183260 RepID=A0ABR2RZG4_9ROSI